MTPDVRSPVEIDEEYESELQDECDALRESFEMFEVELARISLVRASIKVTPMMNEDFIEFTLSWGKKKDKQGLFVQRKDESESLHIVNTQLKYRFEAAKHLPKLTAAVLAQTADVIKEAKVAKKLVLAATAKLQKEPTR